MKTIVTIVKTIKAIEGKRFLSLTWDGKKLDGYNSNLPYKKSIGDWGFYSTAILAILKRI